MLYVCIALEKDLQIQQEIKRTLQAHNLRSTPVRRSVLELISKRGVALASSEKTSCLNEVKIEAQVLPKGYQINESQLTYSGICPSCN